MSTIETKRYVGKTLRSLIVAATLFAPLGGIAFAAEGDGPGPEPTPQPGDITKGQAGWFNQDSEADVFIACRGCPKVTSGTVNTGGRCYKITGRIDTFLGAGDNGIGGGPTVGYNAQEKSCGRGGGGMSFQGR